MDSKFLLYANYIIDNIEGGYYHPDMKKKNPTKFKAMGDSGETMFGMDRAAGKDLFKSGVGKEFWDLIDQMGASTKWSYGYKCTNLSDITNGNKLRQYAAEIMYNLYSTLSNKFLKGYADIISKDPCLVIHLYYACWNGSGWFQRFAQDLKDEIDRQNALIKKGKQKSLNYTLLRVCALNSRINNVKKNSLISDGGYKIQKIWKNKLNQDIQLTPDILAQIKSSGSSMAWLWILLGGIVIAGGVCFFGYKKYGWFTKR